MLEAVLKASSVMIVNLILVLGIGVLSAYLPEERMELVLVSVLLEIIQQLDLVAVSLEVGPYVPVNRNNNLTLQVLCHTKDIYGTHLILHTDGVLTEGTKGNIDIIILTMLCKVNGEVRVTGVIDVSARSLNQVVYCLIIHIGGANACQLFSVLTGIVCGNDTGTVKAVQSNNLQVLDLDGVARFYGDATVFRNTPFYPGLYRLLRSDERYRNLFSS